MAKEKVRLPNAEEQAVLDQLQVRLLEPKELSRCNRYLDKHHYLKRIRPVGERLYYVATDAQGQWLAVLVFTARRHPAQFGQQGAQDGVESAP